jgi:hypothetical protein
MTDMQREVLCEMMRRAFLEIRALGWSGRGKEAADLADAVHNLPALIYGSEKLNAKLFQHGLQRYQDRYPRTGENDYMALLSSIFPNC